MFPNITLIDWVIKKNCCANFWFVLFWLLKILVSFGVLLLAEDQLTKTWAFYLYWMVHWRDKISWSTNKFYQFIYQPTWKGIQWKKKHHNPRRCKSLCPQVGLPWVWAASNCRWDSGNPGPMWACQFILARHGHIITVKCTHYLLLSVSYMSVTAPLFLTLSHL